MSATNITHARLLGSRGAIAHEVVSLDEKEDRSRSIFRTRCGREIEARDGNFYTELAWGHMTCGHCFKARS